MLNSTHPSSLHILVIEDNWNDFKLIQRYLGRTKQYTCQLHNEETLSGALDFLTSREIPIDLILLDLGLPDSMGYETFEKVHQRFGHYPIVVLTGLGVNDSEEVGIKTVAGGAQDFLNKEELTSRTLVRTIRYAIERKHAIQRMEEAQSLARIGSWELDLGSSQMKCSGTLRQILGIQDGATINTWNDYLTLVDPQDRLATRIFFRRLRDPERNPKNTIEHGIILPNGEKRKVLIQAERKDDHRGIPLKVLGTTQDLSQRIEMEKLRHEKELAYATTKLREEFLAKTSHEIRTPLNPILVLTDMLLRTPLDPEQREQVEAIHTAGETLLALVNDILDLAKIEAGKVDFKKDPFSLRSVFGSVRKLLEAQARKKGLELELYFDEQVPPYLKGDAIRLTQIILNLVNNAIKFTEKGGVRVKVKVIEQSPHLARLQFEVKDTGIGIERDKLKIIFDRFQQIDSTPNRQQGGTGLGLSIVRQLVQLQGGDIKVSSKVGVGSTFTFELPFTIPQQVQTPIQAPDPTSSPLPATSNLDYEQLEGLRVLIVEDNPLNQMVTRRLLSQWKVKTTVAVNGKEGVEMVGSRMFDLVLMDLQMPVMDGYEATTRIRQELPAPQNQIPIIALTANAFNGIAERCMEVGMNDYLSKPIEIDNLFHKIVKHTGGKRNHQELSAQPEKPILSPVLSPENFGLQANAQLQTLPMSRQSHTDLSYLTNMFGGDKSIVKNVVSKFIKTTPDLLSDIEQSLAQENYSQLKTYIHKLKGSTVNLGMAATTDTIISAENIILTNGDFSKIPPMINEVIANTRAAIIELEEVIPTL